MLINGFNLVWKVEKQALFYGKTDHKRGVGSTLMVNLARGLVESAGDELQCIECRSQDNGLQSVEFAKPFITSRGQAGQTMSGQVITSI